MTHIISLILAITFSQTGFAVEETPGKGASLEQIEMMVEQNTLLSEQVKPRSSDPLLDLGESGDREEIEILPYAEYSKQKYFIFNDETHFSSMMIKEEFLRNLPKGIVPVIYTKNQSPEFLNSLRQTFEPFLSDPSILQVVHFEGHGTAFWSRDTIPVPVLLKGAEQTEFGVVDAKYYHYYEPDAKVAEMFNAKKLKHDYYFEGGNFLATAGGTCAVVDVQAVKKIPDEIFTDLYGCKNLMRFPHLKGIGHMDESLKFIGDNLALTDLQEYKDLLEAEGFDVILFPKALQEYETYLNSVLLGDVVYVPVFDRAQDEEALAAYRNLGYKTVSMNSYYLSNRGLGSLHCISMVYPDMKQF